MKDTTNKFVIKIGSCPQYIGTPLHINVGTSCLLVFDKNACIGVTWRHYENRYAEANGQAEIRFFERYRNSYGLWHRMFVNKQRLMYDRLQIELNKSNEYIYCAKIRGH